MEDGHYGLCGMDVKLEGVERRETVHVRTLRKRIVDLHVLDHAMSTKFARMTVRKRVLFLDGLFDSAYDLVPCIVK